MWAGARTRSGAPIKKTSRGGGNGPLVGVAGYSTPHPPRRLSTAPPPPSPPPPAHNRHRHRGLRPCRHHRSRRLCRHRPNQLPAPALLRLVVAAVDDPPAPPLTPPPPHGGRLSLPDLPLLRPTPRLGTRRRSLSLWAPPPPPPLSPPPLPPPPPCSRVDAPAAAPPRLDGLSWGGGRAHPAPLPAVGAPPRAAASASAAHDCGRAARHAAAVAVAVATASPLRAGPSSSRLLW